MAEEHIKINPVPTKVKYSGNGVVKEFPTGFAFFENDNIVVYHNGKIINTGYSITGVGETGGGKVIFNVAPAAGDKIIILRKVVVERVTDFQEGGTFRAKNINDELDRQTAFCQQIQEEIERCVKVEVTDEQTPEELLAEVYNKLDSATDVAEQAIGAANQATTAAKDAKDAVVVAQQQITETQAFIEQARADINQTVEDSIEYVEQEAVKAATEVVSEVVGQYTDRAETAAKNAEADASRTAESANQASASATSAAASASEAEAIAGEVSVYNFKNKITNCITEIPQDIKFELNGGKLTLKAGSKVYDGNGLFYTLTQDSSSSQGVVTGNAFVLFEKNRKTLIYFFPSQCGSGASLPSASSSQLQIFFNTSDGTVYRNVSSTWSKDAGYSLPVALVSMSSGTVTSIDQVFNGFGYIGSTVYALPGVKGLIPNGRNEDGSLKNIEFTVGSVKTLSIGGTRNVYPAIDTNGNWGGYYSTYLEQETQPTSPANYTIWFNTADNIICEYVSNVWTTRTKMCPILSHVTSDNIDAFTPKLPFRAVDYNDFNKLDEEVTTLDAQNVKLTGNQTIGGLKTFNHTMYQKNPNIALSTTPSANQFIQHWAIDKNNATIGCWEYRQLADGSSGTSIVLRKKGAESSAVWERIGIFQDTNGKFYTYAPTPAATDNSTKIATTAWVNTRINPTGNNNSWKITYSNGFKIMGGYLAGTNSGVYTVTFPTAFTNLPAILTGHLGTQGNGYVGTVASSKTGFTASVVSTTGRYTENSNGFTWVAYGF